MPSARFRDESGEPIDGLRTYRNLCARAQYEDCRNSDLAYNWRDGEAGARNRSASPKLRNRARKLTGISFSLQADRTFSD
jgi:hypothetical protein